MPSHRRRDDLTQARQMHKALVMYYLEERSQADIAKELGVAHATVNRMIKRGRAEGLVQIKITSPIQDLLVLEARLAKLGGLKNAVVTPTGGDSLETALREVGVAAANHLTSVLQDGQTLAITGGKGVSSVALGLDTSQRRKVDLYPITGLVQGKHYTDVNHVAAIMADKLGGQSFQIHAPLFADTPEMRDMVLQMGPVRRVFEQARQADVVVVGIGSILTDDSSYYELDPDNGIDREQIEQVGARSELVAHLLTGDGAACDYERNRRLVSLTLNELRAIPTRIGVASGLNKSAPILSVLRGGYLDTLITDEATALRVLELADSMHGEGEAA